MKITNLITASSQYIDDYYIQLICQHKDFIKKGGGMISVKGPLQETYQGNFHGLLSVNKISESRQIPAIILNGIDSPGMFNGELPAIEVPDESIMDVLYTEFMTNRDKK